MASKVLQTIRKRQSTARFRPIRSCRPAFGNRPAVFLLRDCGSSCEITSSASLSQILWHRLRVRGLSMSKCLQGSMPIVGHQAMIDASSGAGRAAHEARHHREVRGRQHGGNGVLWRKAPSKIRDWDQDAEHARPLLICGLANLVFAAQVGIRLEPQLPCSAFTALKSFSEPSTCVRPRMAT